MKKVLCFIMLLLCISISVLTVNAEEIPPYDYSSFTGGTWSDSYFDINICKVDDNKMSLFINHEFYTDIPIINNQAEIYARNHLTMLRTTIITD